MSDKKALVILAEFKDPGALLHAAEDVRNEGYEKYDCHSPFPIHGMDEAMGLKRSPLGYIVAAVAIVMATGMIIFQGWTSAIDYPLVLSGKPFFSYQAFGVPAWAVMVLSSALVALITMLALNKLPMLHHPLFYSENFCNKVNDDGFFVSIEAGDEKFDSAKTKSFLEKIGGKNIEIISATDEE